jgi:Protein of unknown function (DUF2934)
VSEPLLSGRADACFQLRIILSFVSRDLLIILRLFDVIVFHHTHSPQHRASIVNHAATEAGMKPPSVKRKDEKKSRVIVSHQDPSAPEPDTSSQRRKPAFEDLHARISLLAYDLYVQRGCREGHGLEDWLDAEREILDREFPV